LKGLGIELYERDVALYGRLVESPTELRRTLEIRGNDRVSWLNGLVTCDVAGLRPLAAMYGLMVNRTGKIQSDVWILEHEASLLLSLPAQVFDSVRASLDAHLIMEDAEIHVSSLHSFVVASATRAEAPAEASEGSDSVVAMGRFQWGSCELLAGASTQDSTSGSGAAIRPGTSMDTLRFRHGIPLFGRDFDSTMHPHEAGLDTVAVSFSKGCYLGQEVVCMVELRGQASRRLARIALDAPAAFGTPVLAADGATVGTIRGVCTEPTPGLVDCGSDGGRGPDAIMAFALLKRAFSDPGTQLRVFGAPESHNRASVVGVGPA
jgi:tRNA-modifying protein YgfZ